ncbi:MAG: phosphoenolpyruvate hydrolase family protein, partial [Bacillota bacterium]|nr:phosphoenolpyruvate hydrolase family protein [Bacillota bacterium]
MSSLSGYFPFGNSNEMVMEFGIKEILPRITDTPVIFGLCANDPTIRLETYIEEIKKREYSGIINYPSVGLIDGSFRKSIEEAGLGYETEVNAIRIAHKRGLFTIAFVFDEKQTEEMINAGADIICVQLGLTKGGEMGAKDVIPLEASVVHANRIFKVCDRFGSQVIKMVYGGPVATPPDLQYVHSQTSIQGYIGGSSFGRIPLEEFFKNRTKEFKDAGKYSLIQSLSDDFYRTNTINYVDEVKKHINQHFADPISLTEMAEKLHISRSYLSSLFKKEVGCSFPNYVTKFRISHAQHLVETKGVTLSRASELIGYSDYSTFSKNFKKIYGVSPREYYAKSNK